ncbi:hypothetical protein KL918_004941 [Ogataea parapolymorpha]|nr:hypothetical protein KL918_004941 [Ogataea parapolymorpha]KAG7872250.1 hypothetical protein KL916_003273 [Ogataea parapolymorpha]
MSGTKGELAESLGRALDQPSLLKEPFHVLAIDVGLRNFSFSRFRLETLEEHGLPSLMQWYKMDLHQYTGIENEDFTPVNYSQIMGHVVRDLVYASDVPDVVVVERQRFRTMGNKNVFEHILKSNILESILVATILAKGSCHVESQSPQKMASVLQTGIAAKTARRAVPVAAPLRSDGVSQLYQFCLQNRRGRVAQKGRRRGRLAAARFVLPRF